MKVSREGAVLDDVLGGVVGCMTAQDRRRATRYALEQVTGIPERAGARGRKKANKRRCGGLCGCCQEVAPMVTRRALGVDRRDLEPDNGLSRVSEGCRNCLCETVERGGLEAWVAYAGPDRPGPGSGMARCGCCLRSGRSRTAGTKRKGAIFVNSMSDLFHENVPFEFIVGVFSLWASPRATPYQIRLSRPERMLAFLDWLGEDRPAL